MEPSDAAVYDLCRIHHRRRIHLDHVQLKLRPYDLTELHEMKFGSKLWPLVFW